MRYRTKILLLFAVTAILTNAISVGLLYELSKRFVFDEHQEKVLSIAATVASMLDGNIHKNILSRDDEKSPEFKREMETLRAARDANRRQDTYIKYLFTIFRNPARPDVIQIGVDPEEDLGESAHPGDVYRSTDNAKLTFDRPTVDETFSVDQWGRWLAATAPVKDSNGKPVAAVRAQFSVDRVAAKLRPVILSGAGALALATVLSLLAAYVLSTSVSKPLLDLRYTVEEIGRGNFDIRMEESREMKYGVEFAAMARAVNAMADGLREREVVKSAFARYVSREVIETVVKSGAAPVLQGDRRRVTILFSDIRGFSTMAENMPPENVVQLLNEYFEKMVEVVFRNGGTLDKFIGDGLMVIFGAPQEDPRQEEHAINTAIEMQTELRLLCKRWEGEGRKPIRIGIGVNSGMAIVGNIGSSQRMEYTAVGDTVNLAARLESSTRDLGVDILVSEETHEAVRGIFKSRPMGEIAVKGRADLTTCYAIDL